ncbi:hypothetical protein Nepgr_029327 [Nepenthes gracilis]|uniref:Uncharacterized protein n=1 Tax=Nepenthes gracilis TaxID=150966 RepID=A0AAD3TEE1_NEPGR|nr:hypothetical protein Nepgr_029327 [Nepenthes gracilis]
MVDEYDRLAANSNPAKPSRIRLFLFPTNPEAASSIASSESDDWFLDALNDTRVLQRGSSDLASVNCLLGLEGNSHHSANSGSSSRDVEAQTGESELGNQSSNQNVQSVFDSPIIETMSSFGSTSSSPSLASLSPITWKMAVEAIVVVVERLEFWIRE